MNHFKRLLYLNTFIGIKTVASGGIKSNFMNVRQVSSDQYYDPLNKRLAELFADGTLTEFTAPELIAEVVYEAATNGKSYSAYRRTRSL